MEIKLLVATHKNYRMPDSDIYLPVHVGAEGKESIGYQKDCDGDNISNKNPFFCELTGLYWLWKNSDYDYCGLVHYRRYFSSRKIFFAKDPFDKILNKEELEKLIKKTDVILPMKRRYYIETLYSHYAHTHYASHLDITRDVLCEMCPDYLYSYDAVMKRTWGYMFNMMIMKKDKLDEYCEWLFPILFELENRIDATKYSPFQARLFGRISELLLNVWIEKSGYSYIEQPTITMERLDWVRKIRSFINAKFEGKKYDKSF